MKILLRSRRLMHALPFVVAGLAGCSMFRTACDKALPTLAITQSYGADAAQAIEQVEAYVAVAALPPETKENLLNALDNARKALRVGQAALTAAADACTQPDPVQLFGDLVKAWKLLRDVLGSTNPVGVTPGPRVGGYPFEDPAVYRLAVSRGF